MPRPKNATVGATKVKKILINTGLEHRQALRACTSIVICKLKLKIDNLNFEIMNLDKIWKSGREKLEIWIFGKYGNLENL